MTTEAASGKSPRERPSRRGIIKLMRGDIIKLIAPKTVHGYHLKTFFVDYIDESRVRLFTADDAIAGSVVLRISGATGRFEDDAITTVELLARSPEPGYARQRGFVKGTWIEIHFRDQGVSGLVIGKVVSLEPGTDCIGVSIFDPANPNPDESGRQSATKNAEGAEEGDEEAAYAEPAGNIRRIYIDFEFKGLSDELNINEIRICDEPVVAKNEHLQHIVATEALESADSGEEESDSSSSSGSSSGSSSSNRRGSNSSSNRRGSHDDEFSASARSSLRLQQSHVATAGIQKKAISDGDLVFGADDELDEFEYYVEVPESMRRYDVDDQRHSLMDSLLADIPTDRRTVGSMKNMHRMIERFTQLREMFSVEDAHHKLHRSPEHTDAHKPLAEFIISGMAGGGSGGGGVIVSRTGSGSKAFELEHEPTTANPFTDWLVPIYVQRRIIYASNADEVNAFNENVDTETDALIYQMSDRMQSEFSDYARYNKQENKSFLNTMADIKRYTTPFVELQRLANVALRHPAAFDAIATCFSDPASLNSPAFGAASIKNDRIFSSRARTARYLEDDRIPERAAAYMVFPLPFVSLASQKRSTASIMEQSHASHLAGTDLRYSPMMCAWTVKTRHILTTGAMRSDELLTNHSLFLSAPAREMFVPDNDAGDARNDHVFTPDAVRNMVPPTEMLFDTVKTGLGSRDHRAALSPRLMVAALAPFMVQQRHVTRALFSRFSAFIDERIAEYREMCADARDVREAFVRHGYGSDPVGVNSLYGLVQRQGLQQEQHGRQKQQPQRPHSAFDATVVAKYGLKEWAVSAVARLAPDESRVRTDKHPQRGQPRILSNAELLAKMFAIDYGRCFMNELVIANHAHNSLFGADVDRVISQYAKESDDFVRAKTRGAGDATCKPLNFILAKEYDSLDELETDNQMHEQGIDILYDRAHDPTDYDFLDRHKGRERTMPSAEFKTYLIGELMKKPKGLSATDANVEAESIIMRARRVQPGDRAVVIAQVQDARAREQAPADAAAAEATAENRTAYYYYKLAASGTWIRDHSVPDHVRSDDVLYFCNVQPECIQMKTQCMSLDTAAGAVNSQLLNSMAKAELISKIHKEFETQFDVSSTNFAEYMHLKEEYDEYRMTKLRLLTRVAQTAQNDRDFLLGTKERAASAAATAAASAADVGSGLAISPYVGELNAILGDGSFARKQANIIMFVKKCTRPYESAADTAASDNGAHWLYCKDSGVKLLPVWLHRKAAAFIQPHSQLLDGGGGGGGETYLEVLDRICTEYGIPDGNSWVDRKTGSGMVIKRVELSHDEGFDEEGFKLTTHGVLETEKARAALTPVISEAITMAVNEGFNSPYAHKINDVVHRVLSGIGIKPDGNGLRERIIRSILDTLTAVTVIMSEAQFDARNHAAQSKAAKGRPASYNSYVDVMIINITLAHIVIALQCAVPDIRPAKTFRGCEKSFGGFPLEEGGGNACIKYVACIAASVKNQTNSVWASFNNKPAIIEDAVVKLLVFIIQEVEKIRAALAKKRMHVIQGQGQKGLSPGLAVPGTADAHNAPPTSLPDFVLPVSLSVKKWKHFFPLLHSLDEMRSPEPLPESFKSAYLKDLRTCRAGQHESHDVMRFKLMTYSLHIQKCIQDIVQQQEVSLLLYTGETPSTENACCDESLSKSTSRSVIQYFASKDRKIGEYNTVVMCLNAILVDITHISRATLFCSAENTRTDAGALPAEFSEDTIYRGFVAFCKLDQPVPIKNPLLLKLVGEKPDDYAAQDDWPDKFRKLKSSHAAGGKSGAYTQEAFAQLLNEVNASAKIVGSDVASHSHSQSQSRSFGISEFEELRALLTGPTVSEHVNEHVDIMPEEMREHLVTMLDTYDMRSSRRESGSETGAGLTSEERDCYDVLADENAKLFRHISAVIIQDQSQSQPQPQSKDRGQHFGRGGKSEPVAELMDFIKTVDRFETESTGGGGETRRSLQCVENDDIATVRCIHFIKNSIRFMMITVPGLLSTSGSSSSLSDDDVNIPKHWKFSENHGADIAELMNRQYAGLSAFCDDSQIKTCVSQMAACINEGGGGDDNSLCGAIVRFMYAIPFVANGRSVLSGRIVRQLYKYFFLRVIKIYAYFITNPTGKINVGVAIETSMRGLGSIAATIPKPPTAITSAILATLDPSRLTSPVQAAQDALSTRSSMLQNAMRSGTEKTRMRDLLITVIQILLRNKREINKTVDQVMQTTNKLKRRETEQMRSKFKLMTADRRAVANELKNLRIGDWNVGTRKGFTQYDKATYDRESRELSIEPELEMEPTNHIETAVDSGANALALSSSAAANTDWFGPDQLDQSTAEAGFAEGGHSSLPPSDGDEYEREQSMRNESGISTTCY